MFEIVVRQHFNAAHALRGYPGKCAQIHGHNFWVEAIVRGLKLDSVGILIDFKDVKAWLGEIIEELDHTLLNEHPAFAKENPSSENIARFFYERLAPRVAPHELVQVKIEETDSYAAIYRR